MKRYLAWAAAILVVTVLGIEAYTRLPWRFVMVERRGPSLLAHLPISYLVNGAREFGCALSVEEHLSYKTFRKLLIICRFNLTDFQKFYDVEYTEDIEDRLVSAIKLFDGAEHVITIWRRDDFDSIRVYRVATDGITKVLETGAITTRGVRYDRDGNLTIETQAHGAIGGRDGPSVVLHVWDPISSRFREQP